MNKDLKNYEKHSHNNFFNDIIHINASFINRQKKKNVS